MTIDETEVPLETPAEDVPAEVPAEDIPAEDTSGASSDAQADDYRGKLNANIRFLEKEGYTFDSVTKKWVPPVSRVTKPDASTEQSLPSTDSISLAAAIAKGTVDEEDVEAVLKFARNEKLTVKDALKNDELKAVLSVRAEKRNTANAANISPARRGTTRPTDEAVIAEANAGKLPSDDEGIARLVQAKGKRK